VARNETTGGGDDPPPRNRLVGDPQQGADGAGGAREPGVFRHLPVGDNLSGYEGEEHRHHARLERRHARSLPMSDVPEADAQEQAEPVDPKLAPSEPPRIRDDVPEADALEQAEEVPDVEEP
jgi:hypothetical protein